MAIKHLEVETIDTPISTNLKPSEMLRWLRMCIRKGWRHTTRVRDAMLADLEANGEPELEEGCNVAAELKKLRKK